MPGKYGSKKMIIMKTTGGKKKKKRKTKKSMKKGGIGVYGSTKSMGGLDYFDSSTMKTTGGKKKRKTKKSMKKGVYSSMKTTGRKKKRKTKKSMKKGGIGIYDSKILTGGIGLYRSKSLMGGSYYLAGDDGRCENELTYGAYGRKIPKYMPKTPGGKRKTKKSMKKKTKIIRRRK